MPTLLVSFRVQAYCQKWSMCGVFFPYGGFHSHGGSPIAGWFMENPSINGWELGVPLFQESAISVSWFYMRVYNKILLNVGWCRQIRFPNAVCFYASWQYPQFSRLNFSGNILPYIFGLKYMLHRTSPKRSSEGNSYFSTQFPQVHIVKTPAISVEYPTCTGSFLNSTIFSQNPHVCCSRQKPGLVHLQNPLVRHTCLGILGSTEFGGVSWGSTGPTGDLYIYIAKKMRWFAIFIRENVGYNRIYWGIYLEFIGDVLGIEWELIWDLIRFLEIRWDFIVIECDSIGFHLIYCKHLHPNFCGWWF